MKITRTLSLALAAVMALVGANAMADLKLTISGTAEIQGTNGVYKGTLKTLSFNEKTIYGIITSAVAKATNYDTDFTFTNLPANGYLAFDPADSDSLVTGFFYVTNSAGFYFPLSGTNDATQTYYSFIELDTMLTRGDTNGIETNNWGFCNYYYDGGPPSSEEFLFQSISSYSLGKTTGTGLDKSISKAILYIHDNPLAYGNPANDQNKILNPDLYPFYPFYNNYVSAVEINGVLTANLNVKTNNVIGGALTLPGSGNFYYEGTYYGVVNTGKATFTFIK